jgi:hypothetical protein
MNWKRESKNSKKKKCSLELVNAIAEDIKEGFSNKGRVLDERENRREDNKR